MPHDLNDCTTCNRSIQFFTGCSHGECPNRRTVTAACFAEDENGHSNSSLDGNLSERTLVALAEGTLDLVNEFNYVWEKGDNDA